MAPTGISGNSVWLVALIVLAACAPNPRELRRTATQPAARGSDSSFIAQARRDSILRPYTAADVKFISLMIGHHAQAILVSRWAPTHGASASVRTLAARIINAQQDEIATMQQWLRDRLQPVPDAQSTGVTMKMDGVEHVMAMPGMLTDAQLKQLDAARGAEFDRLFLTLMIRHHEGAVTMVKELFDSYGAAQDETVFRLASDVNADQSTEIERMQKMLDALPPETQR
ncbi:MAG TPA: DUF305 domain-containing protein [Gemmatimonadaceae bacterium]|nr:DUF305 domain-containing protein [Gemmatimonadaceae bacterium]